MLIRFPLESVKSDLCESKTLLIVEEFDKNVLVEAFGDSFNDLEPDNFNSIDKPGSIKQRYRGLTTYVVSEEGIRRKEDQVFVQNTRINKLNGGKRRFFAPVDKRLEKNPVFVQLLVSLCYTLLDGNPGEIGMHQIRVRIVNDVAQPTPEAVHRDGVYKVAILCVARENIAGGSSQVYLAKNSRPHIESVLMPGQVLILDDTHHLHAVTEISRLDPHKESYRDVIVFTGTPSNEKK
jgi:hypothetical protein